MRIDAIDVFHVAMPLIAPWRTAYGEDAVVESILVRLTSGGLTAWGESCPLAAPCYSEEWASGAFDCVRRWLAPVLVGQAIGSGEELQQRLAHFKGNPFAKAALDTAWWVLEAKLREQPLYRLLGGTIGTSEVGADFGVMDSLDELILAVGQAFEAGFPRVKLKFRPGWDVNMLRAVRQEFPTQRIHIDCNAAYRFDDLELFCRLDDFQLEMIEQPLAHFDLIDHARLQQTIRTAVCLDESVRSVELAEQALDLGSCRYVNIKPGRVGGLTPALEIHQRCRTAGVPCWVGGMLESGIGVRICAALATLGNFIYPADIFPSERFYQQDLADMPFRLNHPAGGTPQAECDECPGIGVEPDLERLAAWTLQHARLAA